MKAAARKTVIPLPIRAAVVKAPPHDPTCVVQRAWSVFRLERLQELISLTITDLQSLPRPEPIATEPEGGTLHLPTPHLFERDPVVEALRACCDELREASGMSGAHTDRAQHCQLMCDYMQQQPPAWSLIFTRALDEYRRAAAVALEASFARAAVA